MKVKMVKLETNEEFIGEMDSLPKKGESIVIYRKDVKLSERTRAFPIVRSIRHDIFSTRRAKFQITLL